MDLRTAAPVDLYLRQISGLQVVQDVMEDDAEAAAPADHAVECVAALLEDDRSGGPGGSGVFRRAPDHDLQGTDMCGPSRGPRHLADDSRLLLERDLDSVYSAATPERAFAEFLRLIARRGNEQRLLSAARSERTRAERHDPVLPAWASDDLADATFSRFRILRPPAAEGRRHWPAALARCVDPGALDGRRRS